MTKFIELLRSMRLKERAAPTALGSAPTTAMPKLWWQDEVSIILRAAALARGNPSLRKELEAAIRRPQGRTSARPQWLLEMVVDIVDWLRKRHPDKPLEELFELATNYLSEPLTDGQVRGIYNRKKAAIM